MTTLTTAERARLGHALVAGDLVTELEGIVAERVQLETTPIQDELMLMNRWSNAMADLIPDGDESRLSNPEGAQESIVLDCLKAYVAQLAAVRSIADRLLHSPSSDDRILAERLYEIVGVD